MKKEGRRDGPKEVGQKEGRIGVKDRRDGQERRTN